MLMWRRIWHVEDVIREESMPPGSILDHLMLNIYQYFANSTSLGGHRASRRQRRREREGQGRRKWEPEHFVTIVYYCPMPSHPFKGLWKIDRNLKLLLVFEDNSELWKDETDTHGLELDVFSAVLFHIGILRVEAGVCVWLMQGHTSAKHRSVDRYEVRNREKVRRNVVIFEGESTTEGSMAGSSGAMPVGFVGGNDHEAGTSVCHNLRVESQIDFVVLGRVPGDLAHKDIISGREEGVSELFWPYLREWRLVAMLADYESLGSQWSFWTSLMSGRKLKKELLVSASNSGVTLARVTYKSSRLHVLGHKNKENQVSTNIINGKFNSDMYWLAVKYSEPRIRPARNTYSVESVYSYKSVESVGMKPRTCLAGSAKLFGGSLPEGEVQSTPYMEKEKKRVAQALDDPRAHRTAVVAAVR
ncbi:hypothetical protein GIB67_028888, partial [Kingdonia uniflora]